ncbi:peptide deformylase [Ferrimonas gelatinilytica]|uniref:Peptide deformylase n=1 Tax=Ferrimonas gelatinilytica TaxID=1255257 RepID=A0ABP9RV06_9GAMM
MTAAIAQLGEPVLRRRAEPVDHFDDRLGALLTTLTDTMHASNGVGIAAPQIFVSQRVMIIASRPNPRYPDAPIMEPLAMINPELGEPQGEWIEAWEGCLSVPGIRGKVRRRNAVSARFQDADGRWHQRHFEGFVARIVQHEFDHLEGRTFLDHITNGSDLIASSVWERQCQGD